MPLVGGKTVRSQERNLLRDYVLRRYITMVNDYVEICTRPGGFFSQGTTRKFDKSKVKVIPGGAMQRVGNTSVSCSAATWYPADQIILDNGEIVEGQILNSYTMEYVNEF